MPATHHQNALSRSRPKPSEPTAAASWPVDSVTWRTSSGRPKNTATAGTMPSIRPSEMFDAKPEMLRAPVGGPALRARRAERRDDARVPGDRAVEAVPDEPVLDPAGDQRTGEQQHAGERGVQRGRAEQGQRFEHVLGAVVADQRRAERRLPGELQQQHQRRHRGEVAEDAGGLRADQVARPRRRSPRPRRRSTGRSACRPSPARSSPAAWSRP